MVDWNEIMVEYVTGEVGYRDLAEAHGVSLSALSRRAKREEWAEKRTQYRHELATESVQQSLSRRSEQVGRVCAIAEKLCDRVEAVVDRMAPDDVVTMRRISGVLRDLKVVLGELSPIELEERMVRLDLMRAKADVVESRVEVVLGPGLEKLVQ